jgi:hypothetical protein
MITLVCLVEEPSAVCMLKAVLQNIISTDIEVVYLPFQGKQDLDKNIENKIKYWQKPNSVFLILRDKDSADCKSLKQDILIKLESTNKRDKCCVRIACHELEAFYLGDLNAVEKGLNIKELGKLQVKQKFRNPDLLSNAAEELKKVTSLKYQKLSGSKSIVPFLNLDGLNKSTSFNILISGIKRLIS